MPEKTRPEAQSQSESVEQLFRDHNRALVNFLATRLHSDQEAREVAQEAYVRLLQLDRPAAESFLRASLFRIAANLAVDRLRRRGVQTRAARSNIFDEIDTRHEPERMLLAEEELSIVHGFLAELPEKCRRAYLLYRLEDKSQSEIAVELNITPRMVRYHLSHALVYCRLRMTGASAETVKEHFKR
jgi:RNA polymerase sigma-70 factor (ECF subfamily)